MRKHKVSRLRPSSWGSWHLPVQQWTVYRDALEAVRSTGLPFLLGGGFGLAAYIGHWRNTKDIDLYILPRFRDALAQALEKAGFRILRQGKHIMMTDGVRVLSIPRHNPVNAITMGNIVRDAGLTNDEFRRLV